MKKLLPLAILLSAVLLAVPEARAEVILGASVGQSNIEIGSVKEDDSGGQFYAGFRFMKFVGAELEYTDFGTFTHTTGSTTDSVEVTRTDLFVTGVIPFGRFEVYGKLGYGYWDGKTSSTGGNSGSDDGYDPAYGVGFAVKFVKILAVRIEYEEFDVDGVDKLSMASIGLDFRF